MRIVHRIGLGVAAIAVLAAVPTSGALASPRSPAASLSQLESSVLVDINAFRTQHGLAKLRLNVKLTAAARGHSEQMARVGYFAHESSDGSAFWKRMKSFYASAHYWSVGENLLWSSPGVDGSRALQMWLASPEHRKNLVNPQWREIGISAVHAAQAPGVYHGQEVTIVTTDFGVRR